MKMPLLPNADVQTLGERAMALLTDLSQCSQPGPGVTRLPFTEEHERALMVLQARMRAAGLAVHRDAAATLIARREARVDGPAVGSSHKTLLLGSHQDSIVQGGRFDGILGVVVPLLALELLADHDLPFAVELLCFADEEGVRFPTALLGPRALAGTLDSAVLTLPDKDGTTLAEALAGFGGEPRRLPTLKRSPAETVAYLEVHIEQGPVLEQQGQALGVVTGICGIERWRVGVSGKAAHAGTTPMELRRDALCGASEMILAVESLCRETPDLVGVVGELHCTPGVVNAIPGEVALSVELRAADDAIRQAASGKLRQTLENIARQRGLTVQTEQTYAQQGVLCNPDLQQVLSRAAGSTRAGSTPPALMSGATHDASAMADLCPVGMLFVRCREGISHHPDESVTVADCGHAVLALARAIVDPDWRA